MKRTLRKWTSLAVAISMLIGFIPAGIVSADAPRIIITSPLAATNIATGLPQDLNSVPRYTDGPVTITATIQNVSDAQISSIYYEITNVKSNPANNIVTDVTSNPAVHAPGSYTITFNNVTLTEGLNEIVIKMGGSNVVSSAPSWAYFTPTTNITNLTANGVPFVDTQSYPADPTANSVVTIAGTVANATSVQVTMGNSAPKTVFLNNGAFFFSVDGKPNSSATFQVNAGDNPMTITAMNDTKSYQIKKNLIYDSGNPYAFNATISTTSNTTSTTVNEPITIQANTTSSDLQYSQVAGGTVEIWTGLNKTGTVIPSSQYSVQPDPAQSGKSRIVFNGTAPAGSTSGYVYYSYGKASLLSIPTTTTSKVEVSANLKDNITSSGLAYRYVNVIAGGVSFGPYDLNGAATATIAQDNGLFPASVNQGYSTGSLIGIQGTGLNNAGVNLTATVADNTGANAITLSATGLAPSALFPVNSSGTMAFFQLPAAGSADALTQAKSPYKITLNNGSTILNSYTLTVNNLGTVALQTAADAISTSGTPLKAGYTALTKTVTLNGTTAPGGGAFSASALRADITDLTGQNTLLTASAVSTAVSGSNTVFTYNFPLGLLPGDYRVRTSYAGNVMKDDVFTVYQADPTMPTVQSPATPMVMPRLQAPTYISVTGANLGINVADIASAGLYEGAVLAAKLTPYSLNGTTALFKLGNAAAAGIVSGHTYDLKFSLYVRNPDGTIFSATPTLLTATGAVKSLTPSGVSYNGETATDISPLQIAQIAQSTTPITITGTGLLDVSKMQLVVLAQDGVSTAGTGLVTSNDTVSGLNASATLPTLSPGNYILRFSYNGNVLAQSPLTISSPSLASISPTLLSTDQWVSTSQMTVTGTNFGVDPTKLSLNLVNNSSGQVSVQTPVSYPTGLNSAMANTTHGVTEVAPIWSTGSITALPSNTSQNFVFDGATVTLTSGAATVAASATSATAASATILNGSTAGTYATALRDALIAIQTSFSGLGSYTFSLNTAGDGLVITGIAGVGAAKNVSAKTAGSTLVFANSATTNAGASTPGVNAVKEVDTAAISGPATATGSTTITVSGSGLPAAGITSEVIPVTSGDSATTAAAYIASALNTSLAGYYTVATSGATLTFTQVTGTTGAALNMAINSTSSLQGGTQVMFPLPNLPQGMYSVSLLYNGQATGTPLIYTVAPPQPSLQENAGLSVQGKYKVFDFATDITIPTARDQIVQFKFYNTTADTIAPTVFSYHYVDPNLPYIDHSIIGSSQTVDEINLNTITEMPSTLKVYANLKTTKLNLYVGPYSSGSVPYATNITPTLDPTGTYNIFTIPLNNIANGMTTFTVIPSNFSGGTAQQGENLTGLKSYAVNVASTPYVIINNIYTGMVVKNPLSEITCTTSLGTVIAGCISGQIVNMPLTGWPNSANVEMYINGTKSNLQSPTSVPSDFDPLKNSFHVQFDAAHGGPLQEGQNTIAFYVYSNGVLVTQTSYNVFVFSTSAPEFQNITPIETSNVTNYTPGATQDTYTTSQTAVSFSGQFANATDLKLTVIQTDANGNQISSYDHRISSSNAVDPLNNNPGYFLLANFTQIPLSFVTREINLAPKGDTIFQFTITNSSNVTITKTITISRSPSTYTVIYPVLTKNANNQDQANINSNFIDVEMVAEGADSVNFGGKTNAITRQVADAYGNMQTHFFYEVTNLKAGINNVKFTILRGGVKTSGSFILYNTNTPIEGAEYKSLIAADMKAFSGGIDLKFPKGTSLMRNDPTAISPYLTVGRSILFGIANSTDGRVDKYLEPAASDGQVNNPNPLVPANGKLLLTEPTGRFKPISPLFWTDAGTIPQNDSDLNDALTGSGRLPYQGDNFFSRQLDDLVVPTQRGTLTLQYNPSIRRDAWKYITVYHYDIYEDYTGAVQFRWHNIGGVVNTSKNTITVPFDTFGYYQVMYMDQSFDDVTSHPWARDQLDTLYSKGIMVNKSNTAFIPDDNISRGEFTALLVKVFDIPLNYTETPTFTDVLRVNPATNGLYDYRYIETAANDGIIRGSGGGRFYPDNSITRQDAAVMIARAANLKLSIDSAKSLANMQKQFTDASLIDVYALASVEAVSKAGFIIGKQNALQSGQTKPTFRFDPTATMTRAESAQIAIQVLRQQGKIPKGF